MCVAVKDGDLDRPSQILRLENELKCPQMYPILLDQNKSLLFPFLSMKKRVKGLNITKFHVFKSAKKPLMITLILEDDSEQVILLKYNDDVRNDVMVMQQFCYFEDELLHVGLALDTSIYGAFAFSSTFGLIECV